jgi:hypothetical protein
MAGPRLGVDRKPVPSMCTDICTPLFSVLGAPRKPFGMITPRVGDRVRALNAGLLPRQREDGLFGCDGCLMCLVVVGTGLTALIVGRACPPPSWSSRRPKSRSISCFPASLPLHPETVPEFRFIAPCSPVTVKSVPTGAEWLHEVKFDGYRVQAHKVGSRVVIYSRNGHDFTERFTSVVLYPACRIGDTWVWALMSAA